MFTFYDVEVFRYDWFVVFVKNGHITEVHNDKEALEGFLSDVQFLVGYNNYNYDDKIMAAILKGIDPYETSQKIINGKRFNLRLQNPLTLDVMQELKSLSLKEAQANLKQSIIETPIDFNMDRELSVKECQKVIEYCKNDVLTTQMLFEKREDYFTSKFEIVKEFKLPAASVQKTRANLVSEVLKSKAQTDADRLILMYDERLPKTQLPKGIIQFYEEVQQDYENGISYKELETRKLKHHLHGVEHTFGFGGLHGALEQYKGEGHYMQIDFASYYPSLIINNEFIDNIQTYKKLYHTRLMLKLSEDPKQDVYKILLNSTFGAMKNQYNRLYHPQMANNIVVNGQLILAYLIESLRPACELIQSNTDGIIIKYEPVMQESIIWMLEMFEKKFELTFDVDLINKIVQKDVNNYVIQYQNGKVKAKGRFANFDGGDFERNSLTIIDKALVDYYMKGIRINKTVVECWKNNELERFQLVAKAGKFDGMAQEMKQKTLIDGGYASDFQSLPKVNRIFASKDSYAGGVFKVKKGKELQYSKVPYTSEHCLVWNDDLSKLDKRKIDLNWYIKEIEKYLF